jgi:hypothetical protein
VTEVLVVVKPESSAVLWLPVCRPIAAAAGKATPKLIPTLLITKLAVLLFGFRSIRPVKVVDRAAEVTVPAVRTAVNIFLR